MWPNSPGLIILASGRESVDKHMEVFGGMEENIILLPFHSIGRITLGTWRCWPISNVDRTPRASGRREGKSSTQGLCPVSGGKGPHKQPGDQRPQGTDMLLEKPAEKVSFSGEPINFHFASVDMEA